MKSNFNTNVTNSRRQFLRHACSVCGLLFTGAAAGTSCGTKEKTQEEKGNEKSEASNSSDCGDLSSFTKEEVAVREKLGYVEESPLPDNQCQNCNLYLPPKEGQACGGCMLFKGPVYPEAYCTYWAPKV